MTAAGTVWLRLRIDASTVLVRQRDVRAIESVLDIRHEPAAAGASRCGTLDVAGERWPVFALDGDLRPAAEAPASRRVCALLADGSSRLGILADAVDRLPEHDLDLAPVPPCSGGGPGSVVEFLAVHGDEIAGVTGAERLARVLAVDVAGGR